jgi:hypothetical protein
MLEIQVPTMTNIPRDHISPHLPAIYPSRDALRHGYPQYYAQVHRATGSTHPTMPSDDVVPSHPGTLAHVAAYGPPSLPEDAPATSERSIRRATQHFNNADYNPVGPSIVMTNIYRDLAIQFIQSPQSNIVMMHMVSAGISSGHVKVTIELEIDGAV